MNKASIIAYKNAKMIEKDGYVLNFIDVFRINIGYLYRNEFCLKNNFIIIIIIIMMNE